MVICSGFRFSQLVAATVLFSQLLVPSGSAAAPALTWEPETLTPTAPAGGTRTVHASFTANKSITDASVRVVPALADIVSVQPVYLGPIAAGQTVDLEITVTPPSGAGPTDLFEGTIQIRSGPKGKNEARPLPVEVSVSGAVLGPAGGTVSAADGSTITLGPDNIPYSAELNISTQPVTVINASSGGMNLLGAFEVQFQPTVFNASFAPPTTPLEVTIPVPPGLPLGVEIIIAQEIVTDATDGEPGLRPQLVPIGIGVADQDTLSVEIGPFEGVTAGGTFAVVEGTGSGFATGVVTEEICFLFFFINIPQSGVTVSNSTNTLVAVTNATGVYSLFISGGPFSVTGFNPFTGSSGSAAGNIVVDGSTVNENIALAPLVAPPITRDGVRNGGFERCNLSSWGTAGSTAAVQQLASSTTTIVPTEGQCMADINTGTAAVGTVGSSLVQNFVVPAGVDTLRLDFNFISEEFPEFVGSIFDDAFRARITTPNGASTFADVRVNSSGGFVLIGDCFFPGGDDTCGQTGWREASVDLSAYAGTGTPITVELLFSAIDAGDDIYDTHVLIDNIRFGTLWVDAKIITGANANQARVNAEILQATEILSQAGINVQLRNLQTIADPGTLLDTDVTWTTGAGCADGRVNGRLTAEETQIVGLSRSGTATDLNVYYVRSLTGLGALAIALGPDDFCVDVNVLTNSGVLMTDNVFPESLAHEFGHITITPATAGSTQEHNAPDAANIMRAPRSVPRTTVTRQQAAAIIGGPLIVP
jgi:hypothetical protein